MSTVHQFDALARRAERIVKTPTGIAIGSAYSPRPPMESDDAAMLQRALLRRVPEPTPTRSQWADAEAAAARDADEIVGPEPKFDRTTLADIALYVLAFWVVVWFALSYFFKH